MQHTLQMALRYVISTLFLLCAWAFVACSDESDTKTQVSKQEGYEFQNASNNEQVKILPKRIDDTMSLAITGAKDMNLIAQDSVKIFAFFPKDCSACMPTFIHLNNLLGRIQPLQIFIISEQNLDKIVYKDFPITLNSKLINLTDSSNKLTLLLDSLKRSLNIEIRDYKAPIFFIQDTKNAIVWSGEGAVLEELFEFHIQNILHPATPPKSDENKERSIQTPNNTLSTNAPRTTDDIKK